MLFCFVKVPSIFILSEITKYQYINCFFTSTFQKGVNCVTILKNCITQPLINEATFDLLITETTKFQFKNHHNETK